MNREDKWVQKYYLDKSLENKKGKKNCLKTEYLTWEGY